MASNSNVVFSGLWVGDGKGRGSGAADCVSNSWVGKGGFSDEDDGEVGDGDIGDGDGERLRIMKMLRKMRRVRPRKRY